MRIPVPKPNGNRIKWMSVALVAILEVSAVAYIYAYRPTYTGPTYVPPATTRSTTTSKTTSTTLAPKPNVLIVGSSLIENDTLMMDVLNKGPSTTKDVVVTAICAPGFVNCVDYKKAAGKYYLSTFVLPVNREFLANLTGICFVPITSCVRYYPVATSSYYLNLRFDFVSGKSVSVPLTVLANNTWAKRTSITNLTASVTAFTGNLTGRLGAAITVNESVFGVNYTTTVNTFKSLNLGYRNTLVSNRTGCGGDLFVDCSTPVLVNQTFTTVLTGIYPGANVLVIVHDLNVTATFFATWEKVGSG